jgi:hypothetical protein
MKLCKYRVDSKVVLFFISFLFVVSVKNKIEIPEFSKNYKPKNDKVYLNFTNEKIYDNEIIISGISGWEPWGRWIDGNIALIEMPIVMSGDITYKIKFNCLSNDQPQGMNIFFGSIKEYVLIGKCNGVPKIIENKINLENFSLIKIIPNYHVSVNGDPRKLSIGLISIELKNDL